MHLMWAAIRLKLGQIDLSCYRKEATGNGLTEKCLLDIHASARTSNDDRRFGFQHPFPAVRSPVPLLRVRLDRFGFGLELTVNASLAGMDRFAVRGPRPSIQEALAAILWLFLGLALRTQELRAEVRVELPTQHLQSPTPIRVKACDHHLLAGNTGVDALQTLQLAMQGEKVVTGKEERMGRV